MRTCLQLAVATLAAGILPAAANVTGPAAALTSASTAAGTGSAVAAPLRQSPDLAASPAARRGSADRTDVCRPDLGGRTCILVRPAVAGRLTTRQQHQRALAITRLQVRMHEAPRRHRGPARTGTARPAAATATASTETTATATTTTATTTTGTTTKTTRSMASRGSAAVPATALASTEATAPTEATACAEAFTLQDVVTTPDRFTTCSDVNWRIWSYTISASGVVTFTGYVNVEDLQWITYDPTGGPGAPAWEHGASVLTYAATGPLAAGLTVEVSSMCDAGTDCLVDSRSVPEDPTFRPWWTYDYQFQESDPNVATTPNSVDQLAGSLGIQLFSPSFGWLVHDTGTYQGRGDLLAGRCDSVNPAGSTTVTAGCVDDRFTPTATYDATSVPALATVADHIATAQQQLPAGYGVTGSGTPLSRDGDPLHAEQSTQIACAALVVPSGASCDAYPFATTRQSAYWLGGPPNVSAVTLPDSAHAAEEAATAQFYRENRILDGDTFWVTARRAGDTASS